MAWRHTLPDGGHSACAAPLADHRSFTCVIGHGESSFCLATESVADGKELTRIDLPGTTPPILLATDDSDVLLVQSAPDGSGTVARRSPSDGAVRWTRSLPPPSTPSEDTGLVSAVRGDVVWFSGRLRSILDLTTGEPIGQLPAWADGQYPNVQPLADGAAALWGVSSDPALGLGNGSGIVRDRTGRIRLTFTEQPLVCQPDDGSDVGTFLLSTEISVHAVDVRTRAPSSPRPPTTTEASTASPRST